MVLFRSLALHADFDEVSCHSCPCGPNMARSDSLRSNSKNWAIQLHIPQKSWKINGLSHTWKSSTVPTSAQNRNFRFLESERAEIDCERVGQIAKESAPQEFQAQPV